SHARDPAGRDGGCGARHAVRLRQHLRGDALARPSPAAHGPRLCALNLASHGLALAIMLPATFCAGTTLPLITFHLLRRGYGEASVGAVYAANTVGAIAGVFFAVHVGLPALGLKSLMTLGGAVDVALGAALMWSAAAAFSTRGLPF